MQRRFQGYSSIEEGAARVNRSYSRLMTLLQHEFGLRIVFPHADKDRGVLQGGVPRLHGRRPRRGPRAPGPSLLARRLPLCARKFRAARAPGFRRMVRERRRGAGRRGPRQQRAARKGKDWGTFYEALKHAENEATFFSFFTLFAEHLPLAQHVGRLTLLRGDARHGLRRSRVGVAHLPRPWFTRRSCPRRSRSIPSMSRAKTSGISSSTCSASATTRARTSPRPGSTRSRSRTAATPRASGSTRAISLATSTASMGLPRGSGRIHRDTTRSSPRARTCGSTFLCACGT